MKYVRQQDGIVSRAKIVPYDIAAAMFHEIVDAFPPGEFACMLQPGGEFEYYCTHGRPFTADGGGVESVRTTGVEEAPCAHGYWDFRSNKISLDTCDFKHRLVIISPVLGVIQVS